jgi:Predicted glycosyltransferases
MPTFSENAFNPLKHPIVLRMPHRDLSSAWMEHVPFAFYIMEVVKPSVFVELGTFHGVSYCAFCQAVAELELPTKCFAVDSWTGDAHTGLYATDVLNSLRQHHDPLYNKFSTLIQSTFDNAVGRFEDGTIDLLHIDGYHTYEAVKHDLDTWQRKLSQRGVVIFHDTNERTGDFGVWKLLEELKDKYPSFEFLHGHGLGIVAVGDEVPTELLPLFQLSKDEANLVRRFFAEMGQRVTLSVQLAEQKQVERNLRREIQTKEEQLSSKEHEIESIRVSNEELQKSLVELQQPLAVRVLARCKAFLKRFLPEGSRQRRFYDYLLRGMRFSAKLGSIRRIFSTARDLWELGGFRLLAQRIWQKITGTHVPLLDRAKRATLDYPSANRLMQTFQYKPLISVVMPVYNTPSHYLDSAIKSVQAQYYPHWELCICDDASTDSLTRQTLKSIDNPKIKIVLAEQNEGISVATNQAAELATGDFIAFLDHDDELTPDALFEVVRILNEQPDLDVIYSDQDKLDGNNRTVEPFFKPDWSPEYFRAVMYVGHLLVLRREVFARIHGLNKVFDGVQDFELMLRVSEQTSKIAHIPRILYHWRMIPGSVAFGVDEKGEKIERLQIEAVNAHLERTGLNAAAVRHPVYHHRALIKPAPRKRNPKVSIVILTKDAPEHISRCLSSIFSRTSYPNFEVVVVDNGTTDSSALDILKKYPVQIVPFYEKFNYSRANNLGVQATSGEIIVLLNNDTEVISPDWLEQMLLYLDDPKVAIVGPMLIFPNKTVQHAGVTLGFRGTADHVMRGFPSNSDGYAGSLSCPRNVSAITGACLMMRRNDYLKTGGLLDYYGTHYQDLDLCLKFLSAGSRIVYVPYAILVHYEGSSRGNTYDYLDRALLLDTWGSLISRGDPYYNPNFSLESPDYLVK